MREKRNSCRWEKEIYMKYAYFFLRLFLIVLFLNSTSAMVTDGEFGKYVCAEEREPVDDLSGKVHSKMVTLS